jgi:hypothetical protein
MFENKIYKKSKNFILLLNNFKTKDELKLIIKHDKHRYALSDLMFNDEAAEISKKVFQG